MWHDWASFNSFQTPAAAQALARAARAGMCASAFLAVVASAPLEAVAERLAVRVLTTAEGLPRDQLRCVHIDGYGFLWLCTEEGLVRFDGHAMETFGRQDGLPQPAVRTLLSTNKGRYWVGATQGLYEFRVGAAERPQRFRAIPRDDGRATGAVNALVEARTGALWIGSGRGLLTLGEDGHALREVDIGLPRRSEQDAIVRALLLDERDVLWIGAGSGLYRRLPDGRTSRVTVAEGLPVDEVWSLALAADGHLWAATRQGLCAIDRSAFDRGGAPLVSRVYTTRDGLPASNVKSLLVTGRTLWVGTVDGAAEIEVDAQGTVTIRRTLRGFYAWAIGTNARGDIWFGTDAGARQLVARGFSTFGPDEGLSSPRVSALFEAEPGRVCAVSLAGAVTLDCFDGRRFHQVPVAALRQDIDPGWGWSQLTLLDRAGEWWISTGAGLWRFPAGPPDRLATSRPTAVYTTRDGLRSNSVFRVYEDSHRNVWVATFAEEQNGISRLDAARDRVRAFGPEDGLPDPLPIVHAFAGDPAGQVWIGLEEGVLLRYRRDRFETILSDRRERDAVRGHLRALLIDRQGRLWIGSTGTGVGRIDDPAGDVPRVTWLGTPDRLSSDTVWALAERGDDVFVATARGVDRINGASGRLVHYSAEDGLPRGEILDALVDQLGHLWLATSNGVARLVPADEGPIAPPPTLVTAVDVDGAPVAIPAIGARTLAGPTLGPGARRLEIAYVSPGFSAADGLRYQYRLEGAGEQWSAPSENRMVTFARTPPGRYRFAVRSVSPAGGAGEAATMSFEVRAPYWRQGWFIALVAATVAALALALHRLRVGQLLAVERVRARLASDLHDDIGASLSRMAILSEVVRRQAESTLPDVVPALDSIAESARTLVDDMSDVVWSIDPRLDTLQHIVVRTRVLLAELFDAAGVSWDLETPPNADRVALSSDQRRHLFLIIKEALTNVAKHAHAASVQVRIVVAGGRLQLEIVDDGLGASAQRATGTRGGRGLASLRRRAEVLGGSLVVTHEADGRGTRLALDVPVAPPA